MTFKLLVDADEILYRCAFAAEKTSYTVKILSNSTENNLGINYKRKEIIDTLKADGKLLGRDYELTSKSIVVEPLGIVISRVRAVLRQLGKLGELKLFLTSDDKSNFRFAVAKTKGPYGVGYKAGRSPRPCYYKQVRQYLLYEGAEEIAGYEADDALGMNQTDDTVLVHQDKDINRIEGKHYNWRTKERYIVEQPGKLWLNEKRELKGYGNKWFFAQMLLGDRVDNIPGLGTIKPRQYGEVKVFNLLNEIEDEIDMFNVIADHYQQCYDDKYLSIMEEIADLLFILGPEQIRGKEYINKFVDLSL